MGENPCHSSCVNRSSTRSPTSRAQVSTSSPPPGDLCTPAFQIAEQLNGVYEKRIAEIEQDADGDARLKEELYIEWIEMLRQVNKTLIVNIQEMERETSERLVLLQRKVGTNCRQDSELNKYRNDVSTLIRLVRNGRNGDWNVNKFQFETITDRDIFGNEESYCDPTPKPEAEATNLPCGADEKANFECQKAKLTANVKALAFEVAEKHDEIRDLKKQILSMEDEIQKAQKKIQLKDDVIKELRNDLKSLPKCNNLCGVRVVERTPTGPCTPKMSIKSSESSATDVSDVSRPGEQFSNRETTNTPNCGSSNVYNISLPDDEAEEEVFKCLKEEFLQFFELRRNFDQNADEQRRAIKEQRDRLVEMVEKLMKSFFEAQSKLKLYRRELIVLENPQSDRTLTNCSDVDSGICSDSDVDVKIINSVRGRFGCLMEENQRLIREQQTNQIQYQEVICRAIGKAELLDKASKALREIAEVLSSAICQTIAYDQLFTDCQSTPVNPFVEAVEKLIENLEEKDNMIDELKKQISMKTNQKLECGSEPPPLTTDLCDAKESTSAPSDGRLIQNEAFFNYLLRKAEKYQEEDSDRGQEHHSEYLRVIDDLSSELNTLSRQVNMVQRDFLTDEVAKQFESSLKGLETQNDLLQSAVESLIQERETIESTLQAQNEELKSSLSARDEEFYDLQTQFHQLQLRPCQTCANRAAADGSQRSFRRDEQRTVSMEELQKLERELGKKSKVVDNLSNENAKLSKELDETKMNQARMKLLQRRGVMSADAGEKANNDDQLLSRLTAAEDENRIKTKSLQKAQKDISNLQQEVGELRAAEEALNEDRELLRNEIIALKEVHAGQIGKVKSLEDQLQVTISELYAAKEQLKNTIQLRDHTDSRHRKELKRFQDHNADLLEKYNHLVDEYNNLRKEYTKFEQIQEEKSKLIQALNAWKTEQVQKERQVRLHLQMYEQHIKMMLEDKQQLLDKLEETVADNRSLLQVIESSSRMHANGNQSVSTFSPSGGYSGAANAASTHPVSKVIENTRSASRRLSQQRYVLEDEAAAMRKGNGQT